MKTLNLLLLIVLISFNGFAQSDVTYDCTDKKIVLKNNQRIKETVEKSVLIVKESKSLSAADVKKFEEQYKEIQTGFNKVYEKMKGDIKALKRKRKICEKYGSELNGLVQKSTKFNADVLKAVNPDVKASGTIDFLILLFGFLEKLIDANDERAEQFYKDVAWKDWSEIKKS